MSINKKKEKMMNRIEFEKKYLLHNYYDSENEAIKAAEEENKITGEK